MNTDDTQLAAKRKSTARIVCLVAALFVILPCVGLHWLRAPKRADFGMSLWSIEWCAPASHGFDDDDGDRGSSDQCQSMSNFELAKLVGYEPMERFEHVDSRIGQRVAVWMREAKPGSGAFAYAGIATLILSLIAGLSLAAAGGLAFKDRFVRKPMALTTVALLTLCLSLIAACVFVGAKPEALPLGVSWPFFLYSAGVVVGIAGAQMLSKAYSDVRDPYWDGLLPEPPEPPAT